MAIIGHHHRRHLLAVDDRRTGLSRAIGVPGIFALTGVLALGAMAVVRWWCRTLPASVGQAREGSVRGMLRLLRRGELARLNLGIFVLHAVLMALFVVVPFELRAAAWSRAPVEALSGVMLGVSAAGRVPILVAERGGPSKDQCSCGGGALLAAQAVLAYSSTWLGIAGALLVFFTGFNFLEASLTGVDFAGGAGRGQRPALASTAACSFSAPSRARARAG
jgi:hypothetical protein